MSDEAMNLSGAEEYVSLSIEIAKPIDPMGEKNVREIVEKADGVLADSLHISEKTLTICYDPARISKDEVINLLKQAGAEFESAQTDRAPLL
jgi:hypothetical protein